MSGGVISFRFSAASQLISHTGSRRVLRQIAHRASKHFYSPSMGPDLCRRASGIAVFRLRQGIGTPLPSGLE